jgi:hypothetical protein
VKASSFDGCSFLVDDGRQATSIFPRPSVWQQLWRASSFC